MAVNGEQGILCDLRLHQEVPKLAELKTTKEGTGDDEPGTWKSAGFSALEYCFADNILLV